MPGANNLPTVHVSVTEYLQLSPEMRRWIAHHMDCVPAHARPPLVNEADSRVWRRIKSTANGHSEVIIRVYQERPA